MTRVLVVDDSVFMRHAICRTLNSQDDIEVVGIASDGIEAIEQVRRLKPDVVTLDVEMPRMDGLRALSVIMSDSPLPVVMLSSLTREGAPATIRALELGAVDFVAKPATRATGVATVEDQLIRTVRAAAKARPRPLRPAVRADDDGDGLPGHPHPTPRPVLPKPERLLVIGCSTGGPRALMEVIPHIPGNLPAAVLVVQHMPAGFTRSLAERLDQASPLRVREAEDGDVPAPGLVLLAPGGRHMVLDAECRVELNDGPTVHGVRPSVDVLLRSIPAVLARASTVAILTGMGSDGADGTELLRRAGAQVVVEDESTTVVYGMPRAVAERGLADRQVPLPQIAAVMTDMVLNKRSGRSAGQLVS